MSRPTMMQTAEQLGWRILPIPFFWPAKAFWHDPNTGQGNAPCICFAHPREWAVIPPEGHPEPARVIQGRVRAVRWALAQANA